MVEQRSPKPRAEGSSPSAPAKQESPPLVRRAFLFYRAKENPRHAERAGQRLRAPPRRRLLHIVRGDFQNHRLLISRRLLFAKGHAPFACSVVNALATALCRYQSFARKKKARAGVGTAVEKIEEKRQPEDFFRAPQEGLRSNFEPFCPCQEKGTCESKCLFQLNPPFGWKKSPSVMLPLWGLNRCGDGWI